VGKSVTDKSAELGSKLKKQKANIATAQANKGAKVRAYIMKDEKYSAKNPYIYWISTDKSGNPDEIKILSGGKASRSGPYTVTNDKYKNAITKMFKKLGKGQPQPDRVSDNISLSPGGNIYDTAQSQAAVTKLVKAIGTQKGKDLAAIVGKGGKDLLGLQKLAKASQAIGSGAMKSSSAALSQQSEPERIF
jgi:hypothetical protein